MRLRFTVQRHQSEAVAAVVDVFAGQPRQDEISRRAAPGGCSAVPPEPNAGPDRGPGNAEIVLSRARLLDNVHAVQRARGLPLSTDLADSTAAPGAPNLDIEMETGTGKTYVYVKTIMELHRRYGWSRHIIVVPSVAVREGVRKTFDITADHFRQTYGTGPRAFVYRSSRLHELERFSSDPGVQVMIINIQAFNATGRDNRRIHEVLDEFGSRRPIDVLSANRPIVIIDEPQKIGAPKSLAALSRFNALMLLRYSATHRVEHTTVHRLDALEAYRQKLVKRISVRGITVRGLTGSSAYLYLEAVEIVEGAQPRARVELEIRTGSGPIGRRVRRLPVGANLHAVSGGIEAYRGLTITDIDANRDVIELSNGEVVEAGRLAVDDAAEETRRRIQIREVVRAHLDKERELFRRGVKVLSLLFIDEVARYRDYDREDTLGDYARMFEQQYAAVVAEVLGEPEPDAPSAAYREYLRRDRPRSVHRGYFSIDRRTRRQVDPEVSKRGDEAGQSTDADAYELILRDKERLLSFTEPVRFLFSHSALREGWDNPNVFVIGMLKRSDDTVSRRQEVGRGLRLAVDQRGERMDDPVTVHEINELTVVTDESYTEFVHGLQKEIAGSSPARPRGAGVESRRPLVDTRRPDLPPLLDDRRPTRAPGAGANPARDGSPARWPRPDPTADGRVEFDSAELIARCVRALDRQLTVAPTRYVVRTGGQGGSRDSDDPAGFTGAATTHTQTVSARSRVSYDLPGELTERTRLTRRSTVAILSGVTPATFAKYRQNPEQFITEAARLINEQQADVIGERCHATRDGSLTDDSPNDPEAG